MTTAVMSSTDVRTQLETARRNATGLRTELDQTEGQLAQAAEALDYQRANTLMQRADELRPTVLLAENSVIALQATVQALDDHEAKLHAAERENERQERAQAALVAHAAEDRAAVADGERLLTEAREHLAAARDCLRAGLAAQDRATAARMAAYQVEVEVGLHEPSAFGVGAANHVSAAIEFSPVLTAVFRSTS